MAESSEREPATARYERRALITFTDEELAEEREAQTESHVYRRAVSESGGIRRQRCGGGYRVIRRGRNNY
jgi:hypothetical protein